MVVNTMVDMRVQVNNVQDHLLNSQMNAVSSHSTPCQDHLAWMVLLKDEIERLKTLWGVWLVILPYQNYSGEKH